jgi:hypothetical protein
MACLFVSALACRPVIKTFFRYAGFPLAMILLAAAYYLSTSVARNAVAGTASRVEVGVRPATPPKAILETTATPAAMPGFQNPSADVQKLPPLPAPATPEFDVREFATKRAQWPATVTLTKATEFPVVAKGKVLGYLEAPAGTEVKLLTISGGKLAVEYQGGGAWVFAEETDIARRTVLENQ